MVIRVKPSERTDYFQKETREENGVVYVVVIEGSRSLGEERKS